MYRYWKTDIKGAEDGKLAGKTVAIKDNIAVAGVPMMNGCDALEGYMPEFDASVVTRILDEGMSNYGQQEQSIGIRSVWRRAVAHGRRGGRIRWV